jgi:hypothetical protein
MGGRHVSEHEVIETCFVFGLVTRNVDLKSLSSCRSPGEVVSALMAAELLTRRDMTRDDTLPGHHYSRLAENFGASFDDD